MYWSYRLLDISHGEQIFLMQITSFQWLLYGCLKLILPHRNEWKGRIGLEWNIKCCSESLFYTRNGDMPRKFRWDHSMACIKRQGTSYWKLEGNSSDLNARCCESAPLKANSPRKYHNRKLLNLIELRLSSYPEVVQFSLLLSKKNSKFSRGKLISELHAFYDCDPKRPNGIRSCFLGEGFPSVG